MSDRTRSMLEVFKIREEQTGQGDWRVMAVALLRSEKGKVVAGWA